MKNLTRLFALSLLGIAGIVFATPANAARRVSYPTNPGDGSIALQSPP